MKRVLIVILILISVSNLHGDAFKLMGGLNLTRYRVSPEEASLNWKHKMAFWVGGGFEFDLSEKLALEFNLLLLQKGSKVEFTDLSDLKAHYNLRVISFPALVSFKFKRNFPVYILGGCEFSFVLSHAFVKKIKGEVDELDLKEDTKSFDLGLVFGCGLELKVSRFQSFFIEGRYHFGLVNVLSASDEYESMKTGAILLALGIKSY